VSDHRHVSLSNLSPAQAGIAARLTAAGLSMIFAESVARRMTQAECRGGSEAALRRALSTELESDRGDDDAFARFEVFVGPPGVGKTTTIAKIAAQERAARRRPLNLVAADGFRVGAIEQLRSYANVIGVPFRAARSAAELDKTLDASRQTAFIDTAGRSPADASFAELFAVFASRRGVRTHLVMAADTSVASAKRILDRYAVLKPSRVVFTKIDETDSILPLFNLVHEQGLPMSYLAAGQRVPEDLQRATPAALAAALLQEPSEAVTCH